MSIFHKSFYWLVDSFSSPENAYTRGQYYILKLNLTKLLWNSLTYTNTGKSMWMYNDYRVWSMVSLKRIIFEIGRLTFRAKANFQHYDHLSNEACKYCLFQRTVWVVWWSLSTGSLYVQVWNISFELLYTMSGCIKCNVGVSCLKDNSSMS